MKNVWAVTRGCYSDYRVCGVFSTKENAEKIAALLDRDSYDKAEVVCWEIDPGVSAINKGYSQYHVIMLKNGKTESIQRINEVFDLANSWYFWNRPNAPFFKAKKVPAAINATVWARDDKHAVKIVNEYRTQCIASGEWREK